MKPTKKILYILLALFLAAALLFIGYAMGSSGNSSNAAVPSASKSSNQDVNWFLVNMPEPAETPEILALKKEISTPEAAIDYLCGRYAQLYGCCAVDNGSIRMHHSGQESLQRDEIAGCDVAPILHYLLEDDLKVSTLLAYGCSYEGSYVMGPYTVLCIEYDDHIEVIDALDQLPADRDNIRPLTGSFDSLESYAASFFLDVESARAVQYLYQMPGNGRYYMQFEESGRGTLLEQDATLLKQNTMQQPDHQELTYAGSSESEVIRYQISTVDAAIAYMDERFPDLMMSAHMYTPGVTPENYYFFGTGEEVVLRESFEGMGRSDVVQALTYLLGDDMQIYTVLGFAHSENGGIPIRAINCIKTTNGYEFLDPVLRMQGDLVSRYGTKLPEATVSSLEEYVALCQTMPGLSLYIDYLYLFSDSEKVEFFEDKQGIVSLIPRDNCQLLWDNTDKNDLSSEQLQQLRASYIDPKYISTYDLYEHLGGITLTPEGAKALVGAEPEVVKEQVKTAADLLMYMLAANIQACDGCYCDQWDGDIWHTNMNARQVMQTRLGNCGSCANLANYLLEGDYEEIGFVDHTYYPGQGGGHVYNYILHEGKYHIVDFSSYMFANYNTEFDHPIAVLDSLEQWGEASRKGVFMGYYEGICLINTYTSPGQQLPCIYDQERYWDTGEAYLYYPEGTEFNTIYDAGDGFKIAYKPFNTKHYDWSVFWGEKDRAPKAPSPDNVNIPAGEQAAVTPASAPDPANITKYDLYNHLGGTTLTPDAAKALVNAEPEVVKEQVKTAADLLMYMMAANIQASNGCYCDQWNGDVWHTNMNARQVMQTKLGNCGSCANLANYLLEGDYEEVGFMDHAYYPGQGGSHVYNYIFHEGKYYIVDFSWYMYGNYTLDLSYPIPVMDDLKEWGQRIKQGVFTGYYMGVNIIVSYTSPGQQLPVNFGDDGFYYFPADAQYTVLYESPNGFKLAKKPFDKTYYDWNVFWGETDRAPKDRA